MTTLYYINDLENHINHMQALLGEIPAYLEVRHKMEADILISYLLIDYIKAELEETEE